MAACDHTICSPSGYSRWSVCTASPNAIAEAKRNSVIAVESSSRDADEGTVGHALFAICNDLRLSPRDFIGEELYVAEFDTKFMIDAEMGEEVDRAYERAMEFITPTSKVWVEQKFSLEKTLPGEKGTADLVVLNYEDGEYVLHIMDLKYGKGIPVNAENNSQLKLYALGAFDNLLTYEDRVKLARIELHILQPRINNISQWGISKGNLEKFRVEARGKHNETKDPEKRKFNPGEHCRFCEFRFRCAPLKNSVLKYVLEDSENYGFDAFKNPEVMKNSELAELWPMLDFLGSWVTNTKKYMVEQAARGVAFDGLKLIQGRKGKRNWLNPEDAEKFLEGYLLTEDQMFERTLITPAKAEKLIGRKNLKKEKFAEQIQQTESKPELAKADDPRPAYQLATDDEFDD